MLKLTKIEAAQQFLHLWKPGITVFRGFEVMLYRNWSWLSIPATWSQCLCYLLRALRASSVVFIGDKFGLKTTLILLFFVFIVFFCLVFELSSLFAALSMKKIESIFIRVVVFLIKELRFGYNLRLKSALIQILFFDSRSVNRYSSAL